MWIDYFSMLEAQATLKINFDFWITPKEYWQFAVTLTVVAKSCNFGLLNFLTFLSKMISKNKLTTKRAAQANIIKATTFFLPLSLNKLAPLIKPLEKCKEKTWHQLNLTYHDFQLKQS